MSSATEFLFKFIEADDHDGLDRWLKNNTWSSNKKKNTLEVHPLHYAIKLNNVGVCKKLLRTRWCDVNYQSESDGTSALMLVCELNNYELFNVIYNTPKLKKNCRDRLGHTAFFRLCMAGDDVNIAILKTMLADKNIDINLGTPLRHVFEDGINHILSELVKESRLLPLTPSDFKTSLSKIPSYKTLMILLEHPATTLPPITSLKRIKLKDNKIMPILALDYRYRGNSKEFQTVFPRAMFEAKSNISVFINNVDNLLKKFKNQKLTVEAAEGIIDKNTDPSVYDYIDFYIEPNTYENRKKAAMKIVREQHAHLFGNCYVFETSENLKTQSVIDAIQTVSHWHK